jgi:hypothetical protein
MTVTSGDLVDAILLGPTSDRRQRQNSPILGDVWAAFAARPAEAIDLLITPHWGSPAGPVASAIARSVRAESRGPDDQQPDVAYLQGLVAARLYFHELIRIVVPMTGWWRAPEVHQRVHAHRPDQLLETIRVVWSWAVAEDVATRSDRADQFGELTAVDRFLALVGIILWAGDRAKADPSLPKDIGAALITLPSPDPIVVALTGFLHELPTETPSAQPLIFHVSLNRKAVPAMQRSVPAVKGDAARTLFKVNCEAITWAVLDSGIDGGHPAFRDEQGRSRVLRAFDFTNIRKIVSLDNLDPQSPGFQARLHELRRGGKVALGPEEAASILKQLAEEANTDRPINWELVQKFIEIDPATPPRGGHGTHVAGIIGATRGAANGAGAVPGGIDGMCPDIKLFDFRVLAKTLEETEFAIIAALQFVRYLNERNGYISVHGANLSLSIPHDVRNFACGRTPICEECEKLIANGVVVVAAAGNYGYHTYHTLAGAYEGYAAFSITDPGNADGVITVGSTHRSWPHTYGVSFFSSRGPTGDGRLKPDLVAPGERIQSSLPHNEWGELDGTSMAAPHVSGAAAMLMARYSELIGHPQRIKALICQGATDLGRERTFQGHGMLDVLRAFQRT